VCRVKDFIHEQDERVQNFAKTKRLSSKNLSNFNRQIMLNFLTKVCPFWMDESGQNEANG
jgi:hypothetical protein